MGKYLHISHDGAIETIAFANPPKNFINHAVLAELYEELLRLRADESTRVVVLTGGMKDSFLTHYDVTELIEYARLAPKPPAPLNDRAAGIMAWFLEKAHRHAWLDRLLIRAYESRSKAELGIYYWARCLELLDTLPKVTIAAINGLSLGGGCEVSLCCDFRFMAGGENYRIGLPEVLVGIIPGGAGTPLRLPRVVGEAKALEMLLTGKLYSPEEALAMGLVSGVADPDGLMPTVMDLARKLALRAPLAVAAAKRDVRSGSRLDYRRGRACDLAAVNVTMASTDALEGMGRYVSDLVEKYEGLELERMLQDAQVLDEGRLVEYRGR